MNNTILVDFIVEFFKRLSTKSPKFFQIITLVSTILALVSGLPYFFDFIGVHLPAKLLSLENIVLAKCAATAAIISALTSQSKPVATTTDGTIFKTTDTSKLPFTTAMENKQVQSKVLDTVETKQTA
jgi:hypothetical protein